MTRRSGGQWVASERLFLVGPAPPVRANDASPEGIVNAVLRR
jgi:hypothetical protein